MGDISEIIFRERVISHVFYHMRFYKILKRS